MMKRGKELLEAREAEYQEGKTDAEYERPDIEWSDEEAESGMQDDLPLEETGDRCKSRRLSRKWVARYATMEEADSEWNQERLLHAQNRERAERGEGSFSEMDGRYHSEKGDLEKLRRRHRERTEDRNPCRLWMRGWCQKGYTCTLKHGDKYPRAWYNDADDSPRT